MYGTGNVELPRTLMRIVSPNECVGGGEPGGVPGSDEMGPPAGRPDGLRLALDGQERQRVAGVPARLDREQELALVEDARRGRVDHLVLRRRLALLEDERSDPAVGREQ